MPVIRILNNTPLGDNACTATTISGGTVEVEGDLAFDVPTTITLSNASIYNQAGYYVLFTYTGTLTGFSNLSVTTTVAGRSVVSVTDCSSNKNIVVRLS
jgi:hypothetical protein